MPGIFAGWRQRRKARMIAQQVAKLPGSRRRMAIRRFLSDDTPEGRGLAYRTWRIGVTAR